MHSDAQSATVRELWRFPVKSMQGAPVEQVDVGRQGILGDRAWAVVDLASGRALSAKTVPELLHAVASMPRPAADAVVIDLPDGAQVAAGDPSTDAALSAWLGREVALQPVPVDAQVSYEMTFDPPDDSAEKFEIPSPEGTFFDLAALHVLSTNSLAACARAYPEGEWDRRRFRPNVLVDSGDDEQYPEDSWVGRSVGVGGVVIDVMMRTVRSAMPLRAQPACGSAGPLVRDVDLYRTLSAEHENHLGVYASVREPGTITVGDPVGFA